MAVVDRAPARVAVLGSDPATAVALRAAVDRTEYSTLEDVRPDCPLSSASTTGCLPLGERWNTMQAGGEVDVLVVVTSTAELADTLAKRNAAVSDDDLIALGAADEAAFDEVLAVIDAALEAGVDVVWYTPAHPRSAYFRHFSRVAVERPSARTVVGGAVTLHEAVRQVVAERVGIEAGEAADDQAVNVLVIGDSTSLNFARALHDGGNGRLTVLWAGANGCPFAEVEATRGRSDARWSEPECESWNTRVPHVLDSFDADVLVVMTGPMELAEHRFPGDPTGLVATDEAFTAARDAQLTQLLAAIGEDLPVLIADLPVIAEGRFSGPEMTSPERLAAVNGQIVEWDRRFVQVARFPYRDTLEAAEVERSPARPIRSDGTHPDVEPLAELAREVYVDRLIEITAAMRAELVSTAGPDG